MKLFFNKQKINPTIHKLGCLCLLASLGTISCTEKIEKANLFPQSYNIEWNSPSDNALGSMPLSGRLGAGANVWVQDGSLWLYLGHNGAYDSQGRLLKLGCIRLTPENMLLGGNGFSQVLDFQTGTIKINQDGLNLELWFSGENLVMESSSDSNIIWNIAYGTWRDKDRNGLLQDMHGGKGNYKADHIEIKDHSIIWYHDNKDEPVDLDGLSKMNGIPKETIHDVVSDRMFGGALVIEGGLTNVNENPVEWQCWTGKSWQGRSISSDNHRMIVHLGVGNDIKPESWQKEAQTLLSEKALEKAKTEEIQRWNEFWERSHIVINPNAGEKDAGYLIGRNYQLFRYMLACNREGELPLLFNGGIFTVDNFPHALTGNNNDELPTWEEGATSPDFRRWMGCSFMSQNQRWLGWPTLGGGDKDLLAPSLAFYRDRSKVATARAQKNGADGVVYTEPLNIWGLCCVAPIPNNGLCGAEHLTYHFSMMLEHAWMALQAHDILGISIKEDLNWIVGTIRFYDSFYRSEHKKRSGKELGEDGKLVIYPSNGLEYAGDATNPIEVVCALKRITDALTKLEELDSSAHEEMKRINSTIPDIPIGERNGKKVLLPALSYNREYNIWEPIEMYAAFPYRLVGLLHPETLDLLKDTYNSIPENRQKSYIHDYSWMANVANAAAMAWPEEAEKRAIYKMANNEAPQARFPAFFGPGHDWIPDHNWGGSGMVGIQSMILQSDTYGDGKIHLLYSWPQNWDVDFKLHTSEETVVIGTVKNGKLVKLDVTPESRKGDVLVDPRFGYKQ